jgi:stage IV sporulation protein FB
MPTSLKPIHLIRVGYVRGIAVDVHWSVPLLAAIVLLSSLREFITMLSAICAFLAMLLIHEAGHLIAAKRLGCRPIAMEIFPIVGLARFEQPWSRFDHAVIAWSGVLAQAAVAIPAIAIAEVTGRTRFGPVNAILGVLGPYSIAIACLNLLPVGRLDGRMAWQIFPAWLERRKATRRRPAAYRSPRSY